ncbi:riboflavin synthase [Companilactobacillus ginsenosidimutans]|uniref:Riboflavin synthase n=1 Tax=Companilactobacillus ginsenosidimutans TaxID=1007676 RepID=A0A0H4QIU2_9LACO|nr:riboflavin synthase [Companilactobacillus ginsenosidimutans]AKP67862.1 riboflavin synthase subunit alpha [Companilactobacillus ginsenosidimutans]
MFTGIIKDVGTVSAIEKHGETFKLAIKLNQLKNAEISLGDSIAVNGTCLTVTDLLDSGFAVEAMPETFRRTNLGQLEIGNHVNIEPALGASDKLDGHFVLGHVDTTAELVNKTDDQNSTVLSFRVSPEYRKYIVEKGSVAIDGVSLTVSGVEKDIFQVSLIPYTLSHTILGELNVEDSINLETDILGKYILDSKVEAYQND